MRILLLAPMVPDAEASGAIPLLLHTQVEALRAQHDLTLVAGIGDERGEARAAARLLHDGVDAHFADRRRPADTRAQWRRRARLAGDWALTPRPWRTVWFATPSVQGLLDRLAAERTFDVVAVEDSSMAMFRLPEGVPAVITEHEVRLPRPVDWHAGRPARWPRWAFTELDWRRWAPFQRAAWHRYEIVQTFTERDAHRVASLAPDVESRVRVNPFGLALPATADPSREEPGLVLFTGNFTHAPNRDAAVWLAREIMPRVRADHPGARLELVGASPTPEVRALSGPGTEVIADAPSIEPYIDRAAVCAAPVRIGGGMRVKVLYALASGKPVVTTTRGAEGYADASGELPMLVADDAAGLAAAIAGLLDDDARRRALGRRARAAAERDYSPAAWCARLETVYEEACLRPRSGY